MANPDVISYIKNAQAKKLLESQIRDNLIKNGWSIYDIQQAFDSLTELQTSGLLAPVKQVAVVSHGMWDAFEHILLFISLYLLSSSIALTLHLFVDKWVPSASGDIGNYSSSYYASTVDGLQTLMLRGYIALLFVAVPIFIFFFLDITKRTLKDSTMRNIRSRKILIYITLIIAFLIMLGHVTFIIYALLSGNVSINLLLHLLVTLFINGLIFVYYLLQVKQDRRLHA